jgi:hypothetical protein
MTQATVQPSAIRRTLRPWTRIHITTRGRLTPHHAAILAVLGCALAFYLWTAGTSIPFSFSAANADIYNQLTTAFLHGHTYLPIQPPAGLLHLSNPYDPAQNAPYNSSYHDLAFRNGHFYSPWGPTPALTLFLLFRLTTLKMSESFAVALFAFIGLVCAVALLHVLVRRLLPKTPGWFLVIASAGLALTNVAPFMLRRPAVYEVAISAGYCFEMAGILLIVRAVLASPPSRRQLALGSLCLGLAVGARLSLAAGGAVALAAAIYLIRRRDQRYTVLIPALVPVLVCALLLAAYNDARFGSFSNFGEQYQLASLNQMTMPASRLAYVPPGLFSYLLMPPRLAVTFPHAFLMNAGHYPFPFPHGYGGSPRGWPAEPAGGMFPTMPITLVLLGLPILWWRAKHAERPTLLLAAGGAVLGLAIVGLLSFGLWGSTQRYEVDYASVFLIAAFLVWAMLIGRSPNRKRARRGIAILAIALTAVGAAVGTAVSLTGYYNNLLLTHPGLVRTLEDATSPVATLATMVAGHAMIARVDGPIPVDPPPNGYDKFDQSGAGAWLGGGPVTVTVAAPSADRLALAAGVILGPGAPPHARLEVLVQSAGRPIAVPVTSGDLRLPLSLHMGLNRIKLNVAGAKPTSPLELYLAHMMLGR